MKKSTFFVGLVVGVIVGKNWRPIAKTGIKAGIRAGRKVRELSQQAMEDLGDVTAEAVEEVSEQDQEKA